MAVSDLYVEYVVEQLATWAEVSVRWMFGGAGLYREHTMFGLFADGPPPPPFPGPDCGPDTTGHADPGGDDLPPCVYTGC